MNSDGNPATGERRRSLAILVFPDAETLDYAGPFEVFSLAGARADPPLFDLQLVAKTAGPVRGRHGFTVHAHRGFDDMPRPDILVVPGGLGTRALVDDAATIDWIRAAAAGAELVLSVCTGAFLLARAGLLDGLPCTTHWAAVERLRHEFPGLEVRENVRFIDNGRIVTSAGVSAGLDMALHVIGRLRGQAAARQVARGMEYAWSPPAA